MFKIKNKKQAFTLIELLVVIAIIGVLSTLAVVALQNARKNARDAKRIADVKQMQTALELYFNDAGQYPATVTSTITYGANVYMATVPTAPIPPDGDCAEGDNTYSYSPAGSENESYEISFCLGGPISNLSSGGKLATPAGISDYSPIVQYALSISKSGTGSGTVTSSPAGINCGATCSYNFDSGTTVTLTATPDAMNSFAGWYGGYCSGTGTCTVNIIDAREVGAYFNVDGGSPPASR
jgi:prepilin-type N-terminal cleavage/methylation domain-containing protein